MRGPLPRPYRAVYWSRTLLRGTGPGTNYLKAHHSNQTIRRSCVFKRNVVRVAA